MSNDVWASTAIGTVEGASSDSPIVGLDFGSSNSCISVWDIADKRAVTIRNAVGNKIIPSNVTFLGSFEEEPIVGLPDSAIRFNTVSGIKAHMSGGHASAPNAGTAAPKGLTCMATTGERRVVQLDALAADIMRSLRRSAEDYVNVKRRERRLPAVQVLRAVIGVPASCSEHQKTVTRAAAQLAGFSEIHFMVESTAAALSYGLLAVGQKTVLVVDMGGGTLDLTMMEVDAGVCRILATAGHPKCGGNSIDRMLADYVISKIDHRTDITFEKKYRLHQNTDQGGLLCSRLRALCRAAKECLSDPERSSVRIDLSAEFFEHDLNIIVTDSSASECVIAVIPTVHAAERGRSQKADVGQSYESSSSSESGIEENIDEILLSAKPSGRKDIIDKIKNDSRVSSSSSDSGSDGNSNIKSPDPEAAEDIDEESVWHWTQETSIKGLNTLGMEPSEAANSDTGTIIQPNRRNVKVADAAVAEEETNPEGAVSVDLSRDELDRVIAPILAQVRSTVLAVLKRWRENDSKNNILDEIVLVGGSSRVLSVRDTLQRVIWEQPEGKSFASREEGGREFCTAVDPDQAVSQGLAIRGAILMGVDRNLLKDVLMIDMLSTSIGLKCFTQASSEISASNSKSDEMFETILMRGVRLPVTNSKLFRLASSKQKLVTVEAFEEVEEASEGGTEVVLQWQYMGTFTCVVPKSCRGQSVGANTHEDLGKYVSITFNMNEFGELSIGISPPNALRSKVAEQEIVEVDTTTTNIFGVDSAVLKKAGENSDKKVEVRIGSIDEVEEFDEESTRTINFLIGVMIFLTAIYLFTKLFILDKSLLDFDFLSSSESFRDDSNSQELNSGENSALPSVDESEF